MEPLWASDSVDQSPPLAALAWAQQTFGGIGLGDARREARLVRSAAALAAQPDQSLAHALHDPAALKACYRLLHQPTVTIERVTAAHRAQTLAQARSAATVLLVQDTTDLDYTAHPATQDLGPIGDGRGRGYRLQSVLAIRPDVGDAPGVLLGVAALEPFVRQSAPPEEARRAQLQRPRESDVWLRMIAAIGAPPAGCRWIHVGDRGADMARFFAAAHEQGTAVLMRVHHDRRVHTAAETGTQLRTYARTLSPGTEQHRLPRPSRTQEPAEVVVGWGAVEVQPTWLGEGMPLAGWVVRVWEPSPPSDRAALEWLLFTTVPTETEAEAWERVRWYEQRWLVEEYHQALKTGCRLEAAQLRDRAALWALLGICVPLAVRLLQLRERVRICPEAPATTCLPTTTVQVVAALTGTDAATLTVRGCWRLIARLGGHQGRRGDGEPGWRTLWRGWQHVHLVTEGVHLAASLPPP